MKTQVVKDDEDASLVSDYEIAEMLGISRTRAWQLRLSAIRKLKTAILADPVLRQLAIDVVGEAAIDESEARDGE